MDIRSFFGGTKKAESAAKPAPPSTAPITSPAKKPAASAPATVKEATPKKSVEQSKKSKRKEDTDDEFLLDDSEDEAPKTMKSRKKLKSADEKDKVEVVVASTEQKPSVVLAASPASTKKRGKESVEVDLTTEAAKSQPSAKKQKVIELDDDEDDDLPLASSKKAPSKAVKSPTKQMRPSSNGEDSSKKASQIPGMYFDELKIAVSGVFESMGREGIEEYIKERGGKISTTVTGKTNFLVIGHTLEDGRASSEGSKYRTAKEKKVAIMTEEEFFSKYPPVPIQHPTSAPVSRAPTVSASSTSAASTQAPKRPNLNAGINDLWVDKYKPKTPSDLIGHAELARKLGDWLRNWDGVHIQKTIPKPSFNKDNPGAKAVLLSGPPGIGKTSVASIIAHMLNYEVLELNASDTRNKREIDEKLVEAVSCHAISFGGTFSSSKSGVGAMKLQRRLVIMDEVDGMGGSDRGGIAELIKVIKIARIPIICICNDRQSPKVKSLANHCFDLRVKRPTKTQIATRLVAVAAEEGLTVDHNAAEILVEQAGNDIRAALNTLQMWASTPINQESEGRLGYSELKAGLARIEKDKVLRLSPFDASLSLVSGEKTPWDERYNGFFVDYSLVPLLVQENYIDAAKNGVLRSPQLDDAQKMEALCQAAEAASDMDLVGNRIRGADQHWELLPTQAIFCMRVGQPISGFQAFPSFPSWLGKYSATNKRARLTRELVQHSSLAIGQGFVPMRLDYVPFLRAKLLRPLLAKGKDGCEEVISMLDEYGLTKDDFTESMREMQFVLEKASNPVEALLKDKFETLDTQTKSALTRLYNITSHTSMTTVQPLTAGLKGKKKKAASSNEDEEGLGDEDEDGGEAFEAEEEEEEDIEALRAAMSKTASKSSKAGAARAARAANTEKKAAAKSAGSKKK